MTSEEKLPFNQTAPEQVVLQVDTDVKTNSIPLPEAPQLNWKEDFNNPQNLSIQELVNPQTQQVQNSASLVSDGFKMNQNNQVNNYNLHHGTQTLSHSNVHNSNNSTIQKIQSFFDVLFQKMFMCWD
ncbi:Hypothetical_protein [Hexamita inflata]|uniref:Hypothetical_protein n=1 Tax=Hexamita inflata TaxID=28002 RepID=A0AA86ND15_9EUKA|nr:Hypothetical protein HINF_LOCUS5137 [Hexamita inflata]